MEWILDRLKLDPEETCQKIEAFLSQQLHRLKREGVLIGLSGGLDSAIVAYLSATAVGKDNVTLLYMPDKDSKERHRQDAELIADDLGIALQTKSITPILEDMGIYGLLPMRFLPGQKLKEWTVRVGRSLKDLTGDESMLAQRSVASRNSLLARGNAYSCIKHRIRMSILYYHAEISNLMVVGAANKTELLTGAFSKWGCDQCADVMPIMHLYRSQLLTLAEYLDVPERIRSKPADPDLIPGVDNKEELIGSFVTTDQILWGLENGIAAEEMFAHYGEKEVRRVVALREMSRHMRESPYTVT